MKKFKKVLRLETADDDAQEAMNKAIDYLLSAGGFKAVVVKDFTREPYAGNYEKITIEFDGFYPEDFLKED